MYFSFGEYTTNVEITREIPEIDKILIDFKNAIIVSDENTAYIAQKILSSRNLPQCVLKSGEENKNWQQVENILKSAVDSKLGRDCVFIAVGGGVIGDLCGFAASIYKRGCGFVLVSTTLLGMADASVGGKTGFDLLEIKNLAGTFYPAQKVFMPLCALSTLPQCEWKSGMAELIKHAVLSEENDLFDLISDNIKRLIEFKSENIDLLLKLAEKSVLFKGSIVSEDPKETGTKRILLNLGHTFAHALESVSGLGKVSHGEAVAWGIVRACELGFLLGITPRERAQKIIMLIKDFNYTCECPHPLADNTEALLSLMKNDKKNKNGKLTFVVPDEKSARSVIIESENEKIIIENILSGNITI